MEGDHQEFKQTNDAPRNENDESVSLNNTSFQPSDMGLTSSAPTTQPSDIGLISSSDDDQLQNSTSNPPSAQPSDIGLTSSSDDDQPLMTVNNSVSADNDSQFFCKPVKYHWFFCKSKNLHEIWEPFSFIDSDNLEKAFNSDSTSLVSTIGGRFDVDIAQRLRTAIYWEEEPTKVRRCSWFYRMDGDTRLIPYDEDYAEKLEESYNSVIVNKEWHKRLNYSDGSTLIVHNHNVIMHFLPNQNPSRIWINGLLNDCQARMVKRGIEDFENVIQDGEYSQVDHLIFVVHGIGPTCDLRFRNIVECVDDFRSMSHKILDSHFKQHQSKGLIGRVEYLPVRWHAALHDDATGIDRKLKAITLNSIGKLRQFTNDTLLDILLYGSPAYAQKIAETVTNEINRLYDLFLSRHPNFTGYLSVAGHSLGSLILFDLLVHQSKDSSPSEVEKDSSSFKLSSQDSASESGVQFNSDPVLRSACSTPVTFVVGEAGIGVPFVNYPCLTFKPACFFALGSPIAMFLTVRGVDNLGDDFALPTCKKFFNIFHPFDPVAYRMEPMILKEYPSKPVLMPHHKGRKRLHLELRENLSKVGYDLKQKIVDSVKSTWQTFNDLALVSRVTRRITHRGADEEKPPAVCLDENNENQDLAGVERDCDLPEGSPSTTVVDDTNLLRARINEGRRVDYVLQEKPFESFNEYLFALSSHGCYWDSEDTVLMILKEIASLKETDTLNQKVDPSDCTPDPTLPGVTVFPQHPLAAAASRPKCFVPSPILKSPTENKRSMDELNAFGDSSEMKSSPPTIHPVSEIITCGDD